MKRLLLLVVVLALVAGGGYVEGRRHAPTSTVTTAADTTTTPSSADVTFAQDMSTHHEQAVLMASLALDRATPGVRTVAESIFGGQSQELGLMRGWLRLWGEPAATTSSASSSAMSDMSSSMPGMASPAQLRRLYRLRGTAFDRLFLTLMIRHHRGGIAMAHRLVATAGGLPAVRAAAQSMIVEQVEDISTMRALQHAGG